MRGCIWETLGGALGRLRGHSGKALGSLWERLWSSDGSGGSKSGWEGLSS